MEQWGVSDIVNRTFTGFKALPEKGTESEFESWYQVLGISYESSIQVISATFKKLAKQYHPDRSNPDETMFLKIHKAYQEGVLHNVQETNHNATRNY